MAPFLNGQINMQTLNGQITNIQATITGIMETCKQANNRSPALQDAETDLPTLEQAFEQLLDVMNRIESDAQSSGDASTEDITEIGEYALRLQESLSAISDKLGLTEQKQPLATLSINIARL